MGCLVILIHPLHPQNSTNFTSSFSGILLFLLPLQTPLSLSTQTPSNSASPKPPNLPLKLPTLKALIPHSPKHPPSLFPHILLIPSPFPIFFIHPQKPHPSPHQRPGRSTNTTVVSLSLPTHGLPPYSSAGLSQRLERSITLIFWSSLGSDHSLHSPQLPSRAVRGEGRGEG